MREFYREYWFQKLYCPVLSHSQEHTKAGCVVLVSPLGASVEQQLRVLSPDMHLRICNPQSSLPLFFPRVASKNRMSFGGARSLDAHICDCIQIQNYFYLFHCCQ